jgi:hypothetical protein
VHAPIDYFESERLMNLLGQDVVNPGIRSHFDTSLAARPLFCGRQEFSAEAPLAVGFRYEPAFHKADGLLWIAAIGVGSEADFEKSSQRSIHRRRDEDGQRQGSVLLRREKRCEFFPVVLSGGLRPERFAET